MRILIVDDEDLARERLSRLVLDLKIHEVVGEAVNGIDALEKIEALNPDIVLLDIHMPGLDGLEVARHLVGKQDPPVIIFTTAYDQHALEAFRVNAVDYLMKPIKGERLKEALSKVVKPDKQQWLKLNTQEDGQSKPRQYLSSRTRQGIILIPIEDVFYLRSEDKYIRVCFKGGSTLIEESLKDLEVEFSDRFLRIHRGCLVQIQYIQALENSEAGLCLRLKGVDECLEISRRHVPIVRKALDF